MVQISTPYGRGQKSTCIRNVINKTIDHNDGQDDTTPTLRCVQPTSVECTKSSSKAETASVNLHMSYVDFISLTELSIRGYQYPVMLSQLAL